jgi:hypothetical protein
MRLDPVLVHLDVSFCFEISWCCLMWNLLVSKRWHNLFIWEMHLYSCKGMEVPWVETLDLQQLTFKTINKDVGFSSCASIYPPIVKRGNWKRPINGDFPLPCLFTRDFLFMSRYKSLCGNIRHVEVSINGDTPIAGWFISWKIPNKNGWFGGVTPISGNLHMAS